MTNTKENLAPDLMAIYEAVVDLYEHIPVFLLEDSEELDDDFPKSHPVYRLSGLVFDLIVKLGHEDSYREWVSEKHKEETLNDTK